MRFGSGYSANTLYAGSAVKVVQCNSVFLEELICAYLWRLPIAYAMPHVITLKLDASPAQTFQPERALQEAAVRP